MKATPNQVRYACLNYHYAKSVPTVQLAFSCYEDDKFIGVIAYSGGANNNLSKRYGLLQGEVLELVRVALNGKQKSPTSKFVAVSIKLVKKYKPLAKLLVSYADKTNQGHKGIIYKASNWQYDGLSVSGKDAHYMVNGKLIHGRSMRAKYGSKDKFPPYEEVFGLEKHRFIYWLYKRQEHESNVVSIQETKGGAVPTLTHQRSTL
jgi:hypothetical protein